MIAMTNPLSLILLAAGSSSRMGGGEKKEYRMLAKGSVLSECAKNFLKTEHFTDIVITIPSFDFEKQEQKAKNALFLDTDIKSLLQDTNLFFIAGGETRQKSVLNALAFLQAKHTEDADKRIVLIHDSARPFVSEKIIKDCIKTASIYGAAVPAITPVDTQKELDTDKTIKRHLLRKNLCAVQTPQAFLLKPLFDCHKRAATLNYEYTDDSEIWDSFLDITNGKKVHISYGEAENKKITFASDLERGSTMTRIGIGTDLHKLAEGRKFILGGVEIPFEKGELGHSDGDVLLHAIADALLGASRLGDIGSYFPPEDAKWKDANSAMLLQKIWADVKAAGWQLENLDCVIECERPKILPWRNKIIESIARILEVPETSIFVKAKTNEGVDAVGSMEAIKTYCVCLLTR